MSRSIQKTPVESSPRPRMIALLEAAEHIFLQKGYHNATMNDVAMQAGMSKRTIYTLVATKSDLFAALLAHHQACIVFSPPEPGSSNTDILNANLLSLARALLSPTQIALTRLIMAEYTHSRDFGSVFVRRRLSTAKTKLEDSLIGVARDYCVSPQKAKELSALLLGMALGEFHMSALIGFRAPPTKQALESRIRLGCRSFPRWLRGNSPYPSSTNM